MQAELCVRVCLCERVSECARMCVYLLRLSLRSDMCETSPGIIRRIDAVETHVHG